MHQTHYDSKVNEITAHRIAGSFHWELNFPRYRIGDKEFTPKAQRMFVDTGTSMIVMGRKDGAQFKDAICQYIQSDTDMSCRKF